MSFDLDKVLFFRAIDNKDFPTISNLLSKHPVLIYEDDNNLFSVPSYCIIKCFECLQFIYQFYENEKDDLGLHMNFLSILNIDGSSALHVAVELQYKEAVSFLLEHGVDPNIQNFHGDTPLNELTLYSNNLEIAKPLLIHGADVNVANKFNMSALRRAISMDKLSFIKLYLRYNGNLQGYKNKPNVEIINDNWLDVVLPLKDDEIKFLIQQWMKQQRRKASSISKKEKNLYKQKEVERQYVLMCEETRKLPKSLLYKFAQKQNIDIKNKSQEQICDELSTKMIVKRNLMKLQ